jgi:hypothetical protein
MAVKLQWTTSAPTAQLDCLQYRMGLAGLARNKWSDGWGSVIEVGRFLLDLLGHLPPGSCPYKVVKNSTSVPYV